MISFILHGIITYDLPLLPLHFLFLLLGYLIWDKLRRPVTKRICLGLTLAALLCCDAAFYLLPLFSRTPVLLIAAIPADILIGCGICAIRKAFRAKI